MNSQKKYDCVNLHDIFHFVSCQVFIMENLHTVGLCLLIFRILPEQDVIRSAMLLNGTAILPAILKLTMSSSSSTVKKGTFIKCSPLTRKIFGVCGDVLASAGQLSVVPLIILTNYFKQGELMLFVVVMRSSLNEDKTVL